MLKDKLKNRQSTMDKKIVDDNEYWVINDNPMTKVGVFPYLGRQISPELEPDNIYMVLRPEEEVFSPDTLKSMELIPLVNEHTMLGTKDGYTPAEEKGIHGVTGTNVKVKGFIATNDLKVFSEELKKDVEGGKKDLSMGYTCSYELQAGEWNGLHYDAIQRNIRYNHIALVDDGRMGKDVRVMDNNITFDSLKEILQTKELQMKKKQVMDADVDKRELIREVMAIAGKPNGEFEGGEEEKIETIAKKLEAMSYNKSEDEDDCQDNEEEEKKSEDEDIEPVEAGITEGDEDDTKEGEDEEEGEKAEDEDVEEKKGEDEEPEEDKPTSMDSAIKYLAKRDRLISRIKPLIGNNTKYSEMNIPQITKYACDKLDIPCSLDALEGYIKAHYSISRVQSVSMDSMYSAESDVMKSYKSGK